MYPDYSQQGAGPSGRGQKGPKKPVINRIELLGIVKSRSGNDNDQIRFIQWPDGRGVIHFTLQVSEVTGADQYGQAKTRTDYIPVNASVKKTITVQQLQEIRVGMKIRVVGSLHTESFESKKTGEKKSTLTVDAYILEVLELPAQQYSPQGGYPQQPYAPQPGYVPQGTPVPSAYPQQGPAPYGQGGYYPPQVPAPGQGYQPYPQQAAPASPQPGYYQGAPAYQPAAPTAAPVQPQQKYPPRPAAPQQQAPPPYYKPQPAPQQGAQPAPQQGVPGDMPDFGASADPMPVRDINV